MDDFFMLHAKNPVLDGIFVFCHPDTEIIAYPGQRDAQEVLGFTPKSNLSYGNCPLTLEKAREFKRITEYLAASQIASYMTVTDDSGYERVVFGDNPSARVTLEHQRDELPPVSE